MIEITCNKQKYQIPASLKEFTLKNYLVMLTEYKTDLEFLSAFAGIPIDDLRTLPKRVLKEDVLFLIYQLRDKYSDTSFMDIKDVKAPKEFYIGKDKYIVPQDIEQCSSGQWFDMMDMIKNAGSEIKALPFTIAIYCLKAGETYSTDIMMVEKRNELFLNMNLLEAYKIHAFFLSSNSEYSSFIQDCFYPKKETSPKKKPQQPPRDSNN